MTDDKMTDDALTSLRTLDVAAPSAEARKIALNAAMAAFDAAQPKAAARGGWLRNWKLSAGLGVPLGTAVAALVLLPLGTQLYTATSHRPDGVPPKPETVVSTTTTQMADKPVVTSTAKTDALTLQDEEGGDADLTPLATEAAPTTASPKLKMSGVVPAPVAEPAMDSAVRSIAAAPPTGGNMGAVGLAAPAESMPLNVVPYQASDDNFAKFDENRLKITAEEPVSTFSIDVDTASYSYVRSVLKDGYLPDPNAVRIEEMINYFPYDYPAPDSAATPFKATMAVLPTPWNAKTRLVEIGIKGYVPPATARAPQNLTFLIDTSGSMDEPNKLPLLKRAFGLLVDTLQPTDTVSIVTYAGSAGVALKPTPAKDRATILSAIDQMAAEGSTDGVDGIALAYRVNAEAKGQGTTNRVILATDGDFNVGIDTPDELKTFITKERDQGISLSVLGFGRGNLDDALMQALAQNGNGNASYIDSYAEARKVLVEEGGSNLVTIAKDVKIQVEFNPSQVSEYRLIGYETRALNREDFNNDAVDAGEIGAGHTVTAIYEITPAGSGAELNDPLRYSAPNADAQTPMNDELGFLKIRYKAPDGDTSKLIETPIAQALAVASLDAAGSDQRFAAAVAAFGQKLRSSSYGAEMSFADIAALANGAKGADADGYRAEFVQLVKLAAGLVPATPEPAPAQ